MSTWQATEVAAQPGFQADTRTRTGAQIMIETLEPLASELPARAQKLVQEWAGMHRAQLDANWTRADAHQPLDTIEPCYEQPHTHSTYSQRRAT